MPNRHSYHCKKKTRQCLIAIHITAKKRQGNALSLQSTIIKNYLKIRTGTPEKAEFPVSSSINNSSVKSFKLTPA
jgi:hypothetical protein